MIGTGANPHGEPLSTVAEWLTSLGMAEYTECFAKNRVDFSVLKDLTDQDLKDLGVVLGDRRKMLRAIGDLGRAALATSGPRIAAHPKPPDAAERRQLTIMFCDLVESTALSTRLDPEDLREIISDYHRRCLEVIVKYGGVVARYMGDGVLAYFGYPQAHEDDPERAVRSGLTLINVVTNVDVRSRTALQIRIGIATGLVVVGDLLVGDPGRECEVVGEAPNLAARLQALAEPNTVVIDSNTRRLLGHLFEYRTFGPLPVKGFDRPLTLWQVTRVSAVDSRFEALRVTNTPLIGREQESDLLTRHWEQARRGEGCVVLISGEPGIGKSRIAETILERLSNVSHHRLRYFCSPHHRDSALFPSIVQLERAARFRRDDTDEQRLRKLEAVLAEGSHDLTEVVPLLAELLSISTGDRYPPVNLTPRQRKERTLHAQLAHVEGLALRQPVLMVFEDMHWSDPTTRELLDLLIDRVRTLHVLVIITFRPEFSPPWIGRPNVTLLNLSRLAPHQCAEMILRVTAGKALPKEIAAQIIDRTDGVPLYVEELTKAVVESGMFTETADSYILAGPPAPLAIPTTLHASLLARLDRLAPTREVTQIAAALGRHFSHELISAVAAMPQQELDYALARLVKAELIFQRGIPPDAEYTFKHALVQDAAYSTLLRGRRQQLHTRIAATLEDLFPEVVAAQPALLAQHCAEAGLAEKAVVYRLRAGQQALARSAMTEAVGQLRRGLDVLAGLPDAPWRRQQELDLQIALGQALAVTKGYSAADVGETIARARALAEQIDRPDDLVPLSLSQWSFHLMRAEYKQALSLAEQVEKLGQARGDVTAQLVGREVSGLTHYLLGEFVAACALLEQCHGLADPARRSIGRLGGEDPYATMLAYLAATLAHLGYIDQARARINEALSEARRVGHGRTLANVLIYAFSIDLVTRSRETRANAEELLALSTEQQFPLFLAWATIVRGSALTLLGQVREGLTLLIHGLAEVRATGCVASTSRILMIIARTHAMLGQSMEGLKFLDEAAQIVETTEERVCEAELHRLRGELLNAAGDQPAAERSYHQAITVAKRQSAKPFELRASTSLARLWRKQGRQAEACDLLVPVYNWFTEGFDTPLLKDAKALLDKLGD
jgi:class 3 adenylate cyclase/tetratricopeptide (TPR) repeat protein